VESGWPRTGKAGALWPALIHKTDWLHIFSLAAQPLLPQQDLLVRYFKRGGVAPACTPPRGMMALIYEFSVPRPKVDKLAAIDLKCKGPSSCPNIDGPKEPLIPQKRHRLPHPKNFLNS
jgi:hypothetical protein